MGTRTSLTLGAFAILALLAAGVSYWALRENSPSGPSPRNVAEAPPPPIQGPPTPENSPPVRQEKPTAESAALQTTPTSKESTASTAPSGPTTAAAQPAEAPAPPDSPSTAAPGQSRDGRSESPPPSAAMAMGMPDEEKMSEANRRQGQEALHRLDFYDGPIDGIFGPLTRAAIRRFQDSIGEKGTGRLTAAEAGRLVSGTGYGTGAGTQGNGDLRIPEAAVGHRQPKPADNPPLQEEQGNVPAPTPPPPAQNSARARGASKRDSGSTGNTGTYGQIPSICTGC